MPSGGWPIAVDSRFLQWRICRSNVIFWCVTCVGDEEHDRRCAWVVGVLGASGIEEEFDRGCAWYVGWAAHTYRDMPTQPLHTQEFN